MGVASWVGGLLYVCVWSGLGIASAVPETISVARKAWRSSDSSRPVAAKTSKESSNKGGPSATVVTPNVGKQEQDSNVSRGTRAGKRSIPKDGRKRAGSELLAPQPKKAKTVEDDEFEEREIDAILEGRYPKCGLKEQQFRPGHQAQPIVPSASATASSMNTSPLAPATPRIIAEAPGQRGNSCSNALGAERAPVRLTRTEAWALMTQFHQAWLDNRDAAEADKYIQELARSGGNMNHTAWGLEMHCDRYESSKTWPEEFRKQYERDCLALVHAHPRLMPYYMTDPALAAHWWAGHPELHAIRDTYPAFEAAF